jgi:hypothetical protein
VVCSDAKAVRRRWSESASAAYAPVVSAANKRNEEERNS